MESIRSLYKEGNGPSSSHTIGPRKAAILFRGKSPGAVRFKVTLFGALAATGRGHLTDQAIAEALSPLPVELEWRPRDFLPRHPNAMRFEAYDHDGKLVHTWTGYSIGGGALADDDSGVETEEDRSAPSIYPHQSMSEILEHLQHNGLSFWEYVLLHEGEQILPFLEGVWGVMQQSIRNGLDNEGVLPGPLHICRKAASYHVRSKSFTGSLYRRSQLFSYALAVAEENAAGGKIITAPTCGSSGVLPAVLYHIHVSYEMSEAKILRALATAGLVGNLVRHNASISGAAVGCQGEIGTACAMAAAASTQLFGGTPAQIEYAAEMGLEHHLGLTCDPIAGLVQIPCIERNSFGAARALDASAFAILTDGRHWVSFDRIVETMKKTGHDLPSIYKETSEGGLALLAPCSCRSCSSDDGGR